MIENFDDTQFLTFNLGIDVDSCLKKIKDIFTDMGFIVLLGDDIRKVKKEYFKQYQEQYFIELKNELFIGEFDDWKEKENPPRQIIELKEKILLLIDEYKLEDVKIIFTYFAEEGKSSIKVIKEKKEKMLEAFFYVSDINFDLWADNYIIQII